MVSGLDKNSSQESSDIEQKENFEQIRSLFKEDSKARFRFSFLFFVIFLIVATVLKLLIIDKSFTGTANIILTSLIFLAAIPFPFLVSRLYNYFNIAELKKRVQSIRRVDARISEILGYNKKQGGKNIPVVDVVFDCKNGESRKFSIEGMKYKRINNGSYSFFWKDSSLAKVGNTGVLSYIPDLQEQGFRGFYKEMTIADFEKLYPKDKESINN